MSHLVKLTDIYFVQNKISRIEGLEGLTKLRNLELGANRIRVGEYYLYLGVCDMMPGLTDCFIRKLRIWIG